MQFNTSRFGSIEVEKDHVITFSEGLPGFNEARQFVFLPHPGGSGPLHWMQCVDETSAASELAFPVVSPWRIEAEYAPTIPGSTLRELGIDDVRAQAQLWAIVTVPKDRPNDATVNLLAPVLVNRQSRQARQVIAVTDENALRTPLNANARGFKQSAGGSTDPLRTKRRAVAAAG
jgi:flagellar assembly factor FliW